MSENTITAALRRMGYSGQDMTGHGFRSMASTLLNEQGWNRDAIERQLAHGERDAVRAAYNYAQHLPERRKHDAGVGGLFGETQEWIGRRGALSESRRLGANICLTVGE